MYNCLVIGLGNAGYLLDKDENRKNIWTHSKAYIKHQNTNLLAVSDLDKNNYRLFSKDYGDILFFKDYVEMIKAKDCDIISICTPTHTHYDIICNIVKFSHPKAIFIEKPMGSNLKEANMIADLCKKANIKLAVNYMRRWDNAFDITRDIINNKKLGNLQFIKGYGCTALLMSSSHLMDLILEFGGSINWVVGALQSDYVRYVDGIADPGGMAFINFDEGHYGLLKSTSKDPYHYMFEIELLFSDGKISILDDGRKTNIYKFSNKNSNTGSDYKILVENKDNFNFVQNERMLDAISDIISCIEKEGDPKSSSENAIMVHKLIDALSKSSYKDNKKIYIKGN